MDSVLKDAFFYWNKTLMYQIILSLLYFSVTILVLFYFSSRLGILDAFVNIVQQNKGDIEKMQQKINEFSMTPNFSTFSLIALGVKVFLYPLEMGLYKVYRKIDLKQEYDITDLFAGYSGVNFFIYISYYLFWYLIFSFAIQTIVLGIVWILITLFVGPLMFFMNQRIFQGIALSWKALKSFFVPIVVGTLVAIAFKYFFFFTFFLAVFTFYFPSAMIYALYKMIFKENFKMV